MLLCLSGSIFFCCWILRWESKNTCSKFIFSNFCPICKSLQGNLVVSVCQLSCNNNYNNNDDDDDDNNNNRDAVMKSIGEDLAKEELMSLRTPAFVILRKESSRVPVNGRSAMGEAWGKEAIFAEIILIEFILEWKKWKECGTEGFDCQLASDFDLMYGGDTWQPFTADRNCCSPWTCLESSHDARC